MKKKATRRAKTEKVRPAKKRKAGKKRLAVSSDLIVEASDALRESREALVKLQARIQALETELQVEKDKDPIDKLIEEDRKALAGQVVQQDPRLKYVEDHPDEMVKYADQTVAVHPTRGVIAHGSDYKAARYMMTEMREDLSAVCMMHIPATPEMIHAQWLKQEAAKKTLEDKLSAIEALDEVLIAYIESDRFDDYRRPDKARALRDLFVRLGFSKCLKHWSFGEFQIYDKTYDQEAECVRPGCGHPYQRHFDWGSGYSPGCKYCPCSTFVPKGSEASILPENSDGGNALDIEGDEDQLGGVFAGDADE